MNALTLFVGAALITVPVPAHAQGPTVADFLTRTETLVRNGPLSADSPGLQALRDDVVAAGRALRAQQLAEREAGRPPTLCMPETATVGQDLIVHLMSIPAAQRNMSLVEGFASYVRIKYPCPR
jgi:hypothetical protein